MNDRQLDAILHRMTRASVAVVGDLFLDKYLHIDESLVETSIETGLRTRQVTRIRCYPGAGGNVAKDLVALGVGHVAMTSVIGDDGQGYEVRRELRKLGVDESGVVVGAEVMTPTYAKPMLHNGEGSPTELNRLDIKNRAPLPALLEAAILHRMRAAADAFDAVVVVDQVQERNFGVVTDRVRELVAELAAERPDKVFFVDSRCRIGEFRRCVLKPNETEARDAIGLAPGEARDPAAVAKELERLTGRPVFLTLGEKGLLVAGDGRAEHIPGYQVAGEIDIVGAGDAATAGIVASLCAGATNARAGLIGCLAASVTVQQIGVTGSATPEQVQRRFREYCEQRRGHTP